MDFLKLKTNLSKSNIYCLWLQHSLILFYIYLYCMFNYRILKNCSQREYWNFLAFLSTKIPKNTTTELCCYKRKGFEIFYLLILFVDFAMTNYEIIIFLQPTKLSLSKNRSYLVFRASQKCSFQCWPWPP